MLWRNSCGITVLLTVKTTFMKKSYLLFLPLFIFSCSTRIQYIGKSYRPDKEPEIFVTESAIKRPYSVIGRGYIKTGIYSRGVNWNKVQRKAIEQGSRHGADAVLIVQLNAVSPLPAVRTFAISDSIGKSLEIHSRTETYYPVSTWHDILFLKYN